MVYDSFNNKYCFSKSQVPCNIWDDAIVQLLSFVLLFMTPRTVTHQGPSVHGISPGKDTGVGCHFLLHYLGCCAVLSCFSCIRPCDPMDSSPSSFSVHGFSQARTLEWVAMPSSRKHLGYTCAKNYLNIRYSE